MFFTLILLVISVAALTACLMHKETSKGLTAIWGFSTGVNVMGMLFHIARGL